MVTNPQNYHQTLQLPLHLSVVLVFALLSPSTLVLVLVSDVALKPTVLYTSPEPNSQLVTRW